ncbi:hypothetical protein [uncultured Clostridium sp.]|uniref:tetratricopeptide repeat protein n=1 Tax=uncultured Clostridium sp. TaxID=59620 RepID=UPI0025E5B173|nr:hypothetical protein [uncultured Clostridium sp.]
MVKIKKRYVISIAIVISISIFIIVAKKLSNGDISNGLGYIFNKIILNIVETEEYRSELEETRYKNYKIVHNKEFKVALPVVFAYLDMLEIRTNELLGFIPTDEVTIQIDYDEEVFFARRGVESDNSSIAGYYNSISSTIYMNIKDVCREVIMNLNKEITMPDNTKGFSDSSFREILFHEYFHYALSCFLKENDISRDNIPMWFDEGLAEYSSCNDKFTEEQIDYVSLLKLNSRRDWSSIKNENKNSQVYDESMYAMYMIAKQNGENSFKDIVLKCKELSFEESFKEVMGISLEKFDDNLKNNFTNYSDVREEINELSFNYELSKDLKMQCLEEYIKDNDDLRAYETLITFYENNKGFEETLSFIKRGIERYPEEASLWLRLGLFYENNNILDLAEECFSKEKELIKKSR